MSATWYTWLEQGRGGPPSPEALDRVAAALVLTEAEREHLFHLALGSPPPVRAPGRDAVPPSLWRVLEALDPNPAFVKNAWWDVIAWNQPARVVLTDYEALDAGQRNLLRRLFLDPSAREQPHWASHAALAVETFRLETSRLGSNEVTDALVAELLVSSKAFAELWSAQDVRGHGDGHKVIVHPEVGALALSYASFLVDRMPGLALVVYTPASDEDRASIAALLRDAAR